MDAEIAAFARRWHMPLDDARRFAAAIARRCGDIAATMEHPGLTDFDSLALAEAIGEQVREALALEFPDQVIEPPGWRGANPLGIGGPSKL
jgi:hypothetical protein